MPVVAAIFAIAAAIGGMIVARRGSLLVGCGLLVMVSYVLGHEFWNVHIGPLPITLDRILLIALFATFALQWRLGDLSFRSMTGSDWLFAALLLLLTVSALCSGEPEFTNGVTSKWGRLFAAFLVPAAVYTFIRQLPITYCDWSRTLIALVVLGVYLALTGVFEVSHLWSFVFPRYISNPDLGIHFGRARGPDLNAVSLGIYLTAGCLCAWTLLPQARRRWQQLALLTTVPLMAFGVLLTYTRSTWIGFAVSAFVVAAFQIPRHWRLPAVAGGTLVGLLILVVSWSHLVDIQREGTAQDAEHSVDQRESFAYVSWQMFRDNPILGVGFGRFFDRKLPYLSDRRQTVELESLRNLDHHNTLLSVLTETGMIGLAAFVAVFIAWGRNAWSLATGTDLQPWVRAQGVLMLALIANYLGSAVFHDLTLLPSQELLLFVFAGLTVNLRQMTQDAANVAAPEGARYGGAHSHATVVPA